MFDIFDTIVLSLLASKKESSESKTMEEVIRNKFVRECLANTLGIDALLETTDVLGKLKVNESVFRAF